MGLRYSKYIKFKADIVFYKVVAKFKQGLWRGSFCTDGYVGRVGCAICPYRVMYILLDLE